MGANPAPYTPYYAPLAHHHCFGERYVVMPGGKASAWLYALASTGVSRPSHLVSLCSHEVRNAYTEPGATLAQETTTPMPK